MARQGENRRLSDIVSATVDGFGTLTPDPGLDLATYKGRLLQSCRPASHDGVLKKYEKVRKVYDGVVEKVSVEYPDSWMGDLSAAPDRGIDLVVRGKADGGD